MYKFNCLYVVVNSGGWCMAEVEVGFKVKQSQKDCEKLLKKAGYELLFNTETHDLYFSNKYIATEMTEQQIKYSCIRLRHSHGKVGFDNYNLFDKSKPNRFRCNLDDAAEILIMLKKNYIILK